MLRNVSTSILSAGLVLVAASASARNYTGSDTLRVFTQTLITQCGAVNGGTTYPALAGASQFTYVGGGSTAGGTDMRNGEQDISPQSRFLSMAEACETVIEANPSTGAGNLGNDEAQVSIAPPGSGAEGLVIALDGMSLAMSPTTGARCDTTPGDDFSAPLAFSSAKTFFVTDFAQDGLPRPPSLPVNPSNPAQSIYTFANFQDVLRILFAGADSTRANTVGEGGGNSQRAANRVARCTSDVRRSLVSQWDNIIQANPATCTGQSCGTLRRLYRRADDSGTTDTFLSLLGLAAVRSGTGEEQEPFCNGRERQDNDPVRRTCLAEDDVCGPLPTGMGLVQAIELYQIQNVSQPNQLAAQYPTTPCTVGVFVLRDAPILPGGGSATTCPDGAPQILGQCLTPQSGPANATGTAIGSNCLNGQLNTSFLTPGGNDGRAFNRELRSSAGNMRNELIQGQTVPTGITNAIHRTRSRPAGAGAQCLLADATLSIGCIAGNVACSLGYAGRESTTNPSNPIAVAAPVGNVTPTVTNIQNGTYPLARRLFVNSILGFDAIRDEVPAVASAAEQEQLIQCLERQPAAHAAAIAASGFIDLPTVTPTADEVVFRQGPPIGTTGSANPGLLCQDLNEVAVCNAPTDAPNCALL
jgi:ABC-type phosphate transport system substrate-binding protein